MTSTSPDLLVHDVNIATLPARGLRVTLEAGMDTLAALAEKAGASSVERFECELLFKRWHKNGVIVTGDIFADITQECVVTLEPVKSEIREEIERIFVPDGSKLTKPHLNKDGELVIDFDGKDEPEPFTGDTLDAWEIALEHFLLGVDPFPRKEGAELEDAAEAPSSQDEEDDSERQNPFAVLKDLIEPK